MTHAVWSSQYIVPNVYGSTENAVRELVGHLRELGWNETDIFAIHISLLEAIANAMEHGNRHDPSKTITLDFTCFAESVQLKISDQGAGFNPTRIPSPLEDANLELPRGRGLHLMRCFMTHVSYCDNGRTVLLEKVKDATSPHAA
jgi:serine/threonine-protein kinase RsbW